MSPNAPCPCGREDRRGSRAVVRAYAECCGAYLDHDQAAPDAEALMRSRYTAFVRQRVPYLLATWHARTRPPELTLDNHAQWLGLSVREAVVTGDDTAEVEFVARYRLNGRAVRLHERSRFVREDGHWFYVDGDQR